MLAAGLSAKAYSRVLGANDRIRLAQLGCGDRSEGHVHMVQLASKQMPVETVAVCDLWSLARERRAAQVKHVFNNEPRSYKYSEEMLDAEGYRRRNDCDRGLSARKVMRRGGEAPARIVTWRSRLPTCLLKPMETRDLVKQSKQVVQVGTQHRSQPYPLAVRDIIRSGQIGDIVHIEQEWNVNEERWRFKPADTARAKRC